MASHTERPEWVSRINLVGDALGGAAQLVPIDADEMLRAARAGTGLDDFGPDDWQEGYRILVGSINEEAGLNVAGRLLTRAELVLSLQNRLRVQEEIRQDPRILEQPVEKPIFICGLPRSGTSVTHELLALDQRLHEPRAWEVFFSSPAPEPATYETDPRIPLADAFHKLFDSIAPEYQTMHENGGDLPVECLYIHMQQFASAHFSGCMQVPRYRRWLAQCDWGAVFAYQRRVMQVMQAKMPGKRWIMKSPNHMERLPALLEAFPDATVILNHRDPLRSLASAMSLLETLQHMRSDAEPVDFSRSLPAGFAALHEYVMRQRAAGRVDPARIVDLHYAELMRDPVACLRMVYDRIGLSFSDHNAELIADYLARKPAGKHGAHRYRLEDFGVDKAEASAAFAGYRQHYGIAPE